MGYAAKLGSSLKPELKIVALGSSTTQLARTFNVANKLPNIYTKLTIDNFATKFRIDRYNTGSAETTSGYTPNTYNNSTGVLSCSANRVYIGSSAYAYISYIVYCYYIE